MDTAVKESVNEWALQRGTFYKEQGGYSSDTEPGVTHIPVQWKFRFQPTYFNVSYSIWNESMCPIVVQNPPNYPFPKTYLSSLQSIYNSPQNGCIFNSVYIDSGFFGLNNISKLCYPLSTNINSTQRLASPCATDITTIKNFSIEKQLADMISNRTQNCLNFSIFQEEGHNITVLGAPNTTIKYDKESFSIDMEYPFLVKLKNKNPVLIKHNFEYKSDLRVTRIHNYILNLLREESQNIFFNITTDYSMVPGLDPYNMHVSVIDFLADVGKPYRNDHILVVEDNASKIGNQSLTFFTAIKNRAPALDYLHYTDANSPYDIIGVENETINISPTGIDPDDKPVLYNYYGWKETRDEVFNYSGPPAECNIATAGPNTLSTEEGILKCINVFPNANPYNWTNSTLFKNTHRTAEFTPNLSDIGIHNMTVYVEDESGLRDWQFLKILIIDKPFINITFESPYGSEFPENITSIEDPSNISAKGTKASIIGGQNILGYNWTDSQGLNKYFSVETSIDKLILPFELHPIQYPLSGFPDINKIEHQALDILGMHTITLGVKTNNGLVSNGIVNHATMNLNVTECLPHRSTDNEYPYNLSRDGFFANHTCCLSDFKYADGSTICFQTDKYGSYIDLRTFYISKLAKNTELSGYQYYSPAPTADSIIKVTDKSKQNDIYQLDFNRSCDGKRGNICAGAVDAKLIPVLSCSDNGNNEVCSGPPIGVSNSPVTFCDNYNPGVTFETKYHLPGATGICNNAEKQSTKGPSGYNDGTGIYDCQGTCDGLGGCSYATNCACNVAYGAQCDANNQNAKTITDSGKDYCLYGGCNLNSCEYLHKEEMPCPSGQTHCQVGNKCIYSISCTSNGHHETKIECNFGETCTDLGCV